MVWISSRKDKENLLTQILTKINIDQSERDLYIISLEILNEDEFNIFFEKIFTQVMQDWKINNEIEKKKLAPFSANIL